MSLRYDGKPPVIGSIDYSVEKETADVVEDMCARSYPKTKEAHLAQDARHLADAQKRPAFAKYKANEAHTQHVIHARHEDAVHDAEGDYKPAAPEERNVRVPAYGTVGRIGD